MARESGGGGESAGAAVARAKTVCEVCYDFEAPLQQDVLLQCTGCRLSVHRSCYCGSDTTSKKAKRSTQSASGDWLCDKCYEIRNSGAARDDIFCSFCMGDEGALKLIKIHTYSKWVHPLCVQLIPEVTFNDETRSSVSILNENGLKQRRRVKCKFCKGGMALQCSHGRCLYGFHPHCAHKHKLLSSEAVMRYLFYIDESPNKFGIFCPAHILQYIEASLGADHKNDEYPLSDAQKRDMEEEFIQYWRQPKTGTTIASNNSTTTTTTITSAVKPVAPQAPAHEKKGGGNKRKSSNAPESHLQDANEDSEHSSIDKKQRATRDKGTPQREESSTNTQAKKAMGRKKVKLTASTPPAATMPNVTITAGDMLIVSPATTDDVNAQQASGSAVGDETAVKAREEPAKRRKGSARTKSTSGLSNADKAGEDAARADENSMLDVCEAVDGDAHACKGEQKDDDPKVHAPPQNVDEKAQPHKEEEVAPTPAEVVSYAPPYEHLCCANSRLEEYYQNVEPAQHVQYEPAPEHAAHRARGRTRKGHRGGISNRHSRVRAQENMKTFFATEEPSYQDSKYNPSSVYPNVAYDFYKMLHDDIAKCTHYPNCAPVDEQQLDHFLNQN